MDCQPGTDSPQVHNCKQEGALHGRLVMYLFLFTKDHGSLKKYFLLKTRLNFSIRFFRFRSCLLLIRLQFDNGKKKKLIEFEFEFEMVSVLGIRLDEKAPRWI